MPRSYLSQAMPDKMSLSLDEPLTPTDSPKTAKQKKIGMRRSSSLRKSSELEDSSSGDEGDKDSGKEVGSGNDIIVLKTTPSLRHCTIEKQTIVVSKPNS